MIVKMENQVMNNEIAQYLLTDTRLPFLNADNPPFQVTSTSLYARHDVLWCGTPLWSVWVTCTSNALSQFLLCTPSLAEDLRQVKKKKKKKSLI